MDSITRHLVRQFYLGDYSALDSLMELVWSEMQRRLNAEFKSLPKTIRYELIQDFATGFFLRIKRIHEGIEKLSVAHTAEEIEAMKIQSCSKTPNFDLSRDTGFKTWMWPCLRNAALSKLNRLKKTQETQLDLDNEDDLVLNFPDGLPGQLSLHPEQGTLNDQDVAVELLKPALEGNELIYLRVWLDHDPDPDNYLIKPDNDLVKEEIKRETGEILDDSDITNLKQSFIGKCYLRLLETRDMVNSLAALFQSLTRIRRIEDKMFLLMMAFIWQAFYSDKEAVERSQNISRELWSKWATMKQRKKVEYDILVAAYWHCCLISPRRRFCYLIELYSDNRFGSKVRTLFMVGARNQNGRQRTR